MEMYSQVSSCFQRTGEVTDRSSNDKVELLLDKLTLYWYIIFTDILLNDNCTSQVTTVFR